MLFAFHGGINNDSTSRADNYGVSVGWNGDAPAAYLGGSGGVEPPNAIREKIF